VYHLRNPILALETLGRFAQYCVMSTRTANYLPHDRIPRLRRRIGDAAVAYLLDPFELNPHDAYNFWIFSEAGVLRLVKRCGWDVVNHLAVGNPKALPGDRDQQVMWCLLRSRTFVEAPTE